MKTRYIVLFLLIPSLAFASVGDEINDLLEQFFGSEEPVITDDLEVNKELLEKDDIEIEAAHEPEKINIEDLATGSGLSPEAKQIRAEILQAESRLSDFENRIFGLERELWENRSRRHAVESDLQLLDSEMGFTSEKVDYLSTQEEKWKKDLEEITRRKSDIKAQIRVFTEEYIDFVTKNFVRSETMGSGDNISLLNWLFSDKTAAQIIEEKRQARRHQKQQKVRLAKLDKMKSNLDTHERQAAILYGKISRIKNRLLTEKINLKEFANAKANLIAQLEYTEGQKQKALRRFQEQKKASESTLESLRNNLSQTDKTLMKNLQKGASVLLDFPLKVPLEITASFHDPEYKAEFGVEHTGTDFFAPQGSDIYAPADGVVKKAEPNDYNYSYFVIQHGPDFYTVYGHVSDILVTENQEVKRGDLVGKTGGTPGTPGAGYFTAGPHLHLEVYKDGDFQDAMLFISEPKPENEPEASEENLETEVESEEEGEPMPVIEGKEVGNER